jgi:hypothetical protein
MVDTLKGKNMYTLRTTNIVFNHSLDSWFTVLKKTDGQPTILSNELEMPAKSFGGLFLKHSTMRNVSPFTCFDNRI